MYHQIIISVRKGNDFEQYRPSYSYWQIPIKESGQKYIGFLYEGVSSAVGVKEVVFLKKIG